MGSQADLFFSDDGICKWEIEPELQGSGNIYQHLLLSACRRYGSYMALEYFGILAMSHAIHPSEARL